MWFWYFNAFDLYSGYMAEPNIMIGYIEMCFNIAEAINRGWATGNAEDWYKKGVSASLALLNKLSPPPYLISHRVFQF